MVFSSSIFLLYFLPIFIVVYYLIKDEFKNTAIVIASLIFYVWGAPLYISVVLITMISDFYFARIIYNSTGKRKKLYLAVALTINIGLLLYFKYFNFFMDNINAVLVGFGFESIHFLRVALPIGISFFTFHEMSFLIDVYRNDKPPLKKITDYALYILFFPQLIAGPIIRFHEIADQIESKVKKDDIDNRILGFFRFIIGLAKKVLIANVMGQQADIIFDLPANEVTTFIAWIGILAYAFQIYFDFSGYSDMAIGLARMFGYIFPENFNNPYISQNITELWRRWHITLSRWMRDYLYISLGGNKVKTRQRLYFNLWVVFIISGFWHGAEWTFLIWGAYHGLFLILDRLFLIKILSKAGKLTRISITFFITLIGWVFFRAESLPQAITYLKKMFSFQYIIMSDFILDSKFVVILFVAFFFSFFAIFKGVEEWQNRVYFNKPSMKNVFVMTGISLILLIVSISSITASDFNPFIYFRF